MAFPGSGKVEEVWGYGAGDARPIPPYYFWILMQGKV